MPLKVHIVTLYFLCLAFMTLLISCSTSRRLIYGNYYSVGDYIVERNNTDGWRYGHYLLTIDSSNAFVLKEVSDGVGTRYAICSGLLQCQGGNSYALKKNKKEYAYGVLGNPYYNDNEYRIVIEKNNTIVLMNGQWRTILRLIPNDSVPDRFDFTKFGCDSL